MAVECGAAINIPNRLGLTPLTMAAYLARMDMFFHIASIEREIYWQLGNVTCSAYPLKYLDTIDSDTGELNPISALNLIVFGPKLEHLDLIEYVIVDLLKVKWETFIKREFFKQMLQFTIFFCLAITAFVLRPLVPESSCRQINENNKTDIFNNQTDLPWTTDIEQTLNITTVMELLAGNVTNSTCEMVTKTSLTNCYLHSFETPLQQLRLACEILIVIFALLFLLKAIREFSFLGPKIFLENMQLCPSRVIFLFSCILLQV